MTAAFILTPGASADRNQPALVAIDRAVTALGGIEVHRIDLGSTRAPVVIKKIADAAAEADAKHLYLGGRSMGGRMCSVAVADGTIANAKGLVLVSYPLHPPGRPQQLRTEHFPKITVPCLFVSGTKDAFGTPAELEHHTAAIPGEVTHVWIEGAPHGLKGKDQQVADAVAAWLGPRLRRR